MALSVERVDLGTLADQIAVELQDARGRLRVHRRGDTEGVWDVDRILQILSNLMGNAVRHSPADAPISISIDGERADVVELRVSNGGPPIPEEARATIFEPFSRRRTSRRNGEGLGLGLYITKELVEAHGGVVSVESSATRGTLFTVTLPRHGGRALVLGAPGP